MVHGLLALAVVFIGMVHSILVGEHLSTFWKQGLWAGALLAVMYLVVHSRVVRPWRMKRTPYRVVSVDAVLDDTYTLSVEPVDRAGMRFRSGQFAWITVGRSPYSLQQHPFSFSSSERDKALSFTAKALGDFTSTWKDIEPGTPVFLEGPYGGFVLEPDVVGAVFIAGGIGVTPMMSILRTMRDNGDQRPTFLFYGNPNRNEIAFAEELRELESVIRLHVVHVLDDPADDWDGESGFIDQDLLERLRPADRRNFEYFICGPEPMMDQTETALRDMGVSWRQIYTERFQIV